MTDNKQYIKLTHPEKTGVYHYQFKTEITNTTTLQTNISNKKLSIFYQGTIKEHHRYTIVCTANDFLGDNPEANFILNQLSHLFYIVTVHVNEEGTITAIHNHKHIQSIWEKRRANIVKENKGLILSNYLVTIDSIVNYKTNMIAFLKEYNMYGLLFNGSLGHYEPGIEKYKKIETENLSWEEKTKAHQEQGTEKKIRLKRNTYQETKTCSSNYYYQNNYLKEIEAQVKTIDHQIKYSLLCLGLKERGIRGFFLD